jgi:hypothetical protein
MTMPVVTKSLNPSGQLPIFPTSSTIRTLVLNHHCRAVIFFALGCRPVLSNYLVFGFKTQEVAPHEHHQ